MIIVTRHHLATREDDRLPTGVVSLRVFLSNSASAPDTMHFIHSDEHKAFSSIVVVTQVRAFIRSAPDVKL